MQSACLRPVAVSRHDRSGTVTLSCVYRELSPCSPALMMTFASDSPCRMTYRSNGIPMNAFPHFVILLCCCVCCLVALCFVVFCRRRLPPFPAVLFPRPAVSVIVRAALPSAAPCGNRTASIQVRGMGFAIPPDCSSLPPRYTQSCRFAAALMPTAQQFTHMSPVIQLLPGARRSLRAALQAYNDAMRLKANCRVDFGDEGDLFLMFHGYGNDEHEMIRIIDAVDAEADYYSFRGTYARRYMGGNYWYPDGCDVESRRHECRVVGDAVVALTGSAAFAGRRKILIGFSQGRNPRRGAVHVPGHGACDLRPRDRRHP